jgi:hypothetical protein
MNGRSEAEASVAVPAAVPLRRNSGFRMLWIGQLLSDTGTEIGMLAYPLLILALTHSAVSPEWWEQQGRWSGYACSCPPGHCRTGSTGG